MVVVLEVLRFLIQYKDLLVVGVRLLAVTQVVVVVVLVLLVVMHQTVQQVEMEEMVVK